MDNIAMLTVASNPDLNVARGDARVSHAQAFAAGLLPDPQLNFIHDIPQSPHPGTIRAFMPAHGDTINAVIQPHFNSRTGRFDGQDWLEPVVAEMADGGQGERKK